MKSNLYLERQALSWFYRCTALGILVLIFVGGMVTTKDAGLAVPDWPLSFGSVNPDGWWLIAKVRLEHSHRLIGALMGMMVTVAMIWGYARLGWSRLPWWSTVAFFAILAQGIMGGLRVTEVSTTLAIFHGIFGQLVFCLMVILGWVYSTRWTTQAAPSGMSMKLLRRPAILVGLIITQLMVAAILRHHNVGMAIPDFPLNNGRIIPEFTSWAVTINFAHRVLAFLILGLSIDCATAILPSRVRDRFLRRSAIAVLLFVIVQVCLGVATIWTVGAPIPTTLHVANGALVLASALTLLTRAVWLFQMESRGAARTTHAPAVGFATAR